MCGLGGRSGAGRRRRRRADFVRGNTRASGGSARKPYRPLSGKDVEAMKPQRRYFLLLMAAWGAASFAHAESDFLGQARQALDDGLPSVAIYRLQAAPHPWKLAE